ncbi:hypothetical protein MRQ36_25215 [Micromonospora sp. R77]|nr:hypothetical protein [Micromonospora sp. R77]MCI4065677.1 hypothetical protein [Micromonospora sp. R77]
MAGSPRVAAWKRSASAGAVVMYSYQQGRPGPGATTSPPVRTRKAPPVGSYTCSPSSRAPARPAAARTASASSATKTVHQRAGPSAAPRRAAGSPSASAVDPVYVQPNRSA